MISVLHVGQFGYPWEVRAAKINRALRAAGFRIAFLGRRRVDEPDRATDDGIPVFRVGPPGLLSTPVPGNVLWTRRIEAAARETAADLILVREIPVALNALRAARSLDIPLVLDMAEHYPEAMRSWKKYSSYPLRKVVHDWRVPDAIERRVVNAADGIIVVCEEQKERLAQEYGYSLDQIGVVMNTPEPDLIEPSGETGGSVRDRFGYHGILCEDRELEVVLQGFEIAARTEPGITLLLAGAGESERDLRALADGLDSSDRIRFTGRYAPAELPGLWAAVDYGIVSLRRNRFTEHTLGNKFFDYAALGKPFIFPAIGPLLRVMERMRCGIPFEPGSPESVARAFAEIRAANYEQLSRNGLGSVRREFNWDVDSARLVAFLARYARSRSPA